MDDVSDKSPPPVADDDDLEALIDLQLSPERESQVWRDISLNPELFDRYSRLVAQRHHLRSWWAQESPETRKSLLDWPEEEPGPALFPRYGTKH